MAGDPASGASEDSKIREIVVVPSSLTECDEAPSVDLGAALRAMTDFVEQKTTECELIIAQTSAVSFTANSLQSRIMSTELGTKLAKLYEALNVTKMEDFDARLEELSLESEMGELIQRLKKTFTAWELFLCTVDQELEKVTGPNMTKPELGSTDDIHLVSQNKMFKNSTLLSYVKSSSYEMMFLEVVASFSVQECYEHVKKMFDHLAEFHKLSCDILLLTKRPATDGGGFLKLIGMPFRMLLNENESLKQILMHRQSAASMGGLRAIHIYAELICGEHTLEISAKPSSQAPSEAGGGDADTAVTEHSTLTSSDPPPAAVFGSQSGCVLINRKGRILYSYICTDNTDWPDVEVLLEQVRNNKNIRSQTAAGVEGAEKEGTHSNATTAEVQSTDDRPDNSNPTGKQKTVDDIGDQAPTTTADGPITVYRKKCCTIM